MPKEKPLAGRELNPAISPSAGVMKRAARIKLILMDVDGVLTDGGIILIGDNLEAKQFNVRDGMGITMARLAGLKVGIITGRSSTVVTRRAYELGVDELYQGHLNKEGDYQQIIEKYQLQDDEVAFIGDDLLDLPVLRRVGLAVAVADAVAEIKQAAHYITTLDGGRGAVRETIDIVLQATGKKEAILAELSKIKNC